MKSVSMHRRMISGMLEVILDGVGRYYLGNYLGLIEEMGGREAFKEKYSKYVGASAWQALKLIVAVLMLIRGKSTGTI